MSERIIIRHAQGFDVIEGHRLNREPPSRVEADRLAHSPLVAAKVPESIGSPTDPIAAPKPKPAPPSPPLTREEAMARRAAADYASMDRANRKPIPAAAFEVDRWASRGGSAGFSCDGRLWSGKKPR